MRLGVPFIAPRQLGAVESKSGRPSLPSVVGRTGQSGAHRTLSGARFLSLTGAADRCRPLQIWRTGQSGASFRPLARPRVARRFRGRPLAHRTVRCTPDSPVNFSLSRRRKTRERLVCAALIWRTGHCPVHTGQSGAPARSSPLALHSQVFSSLLLSVSNT